MNLFDFAEGTFKMDKILEFLDCNKFPLVTKLTELNSARVYSSPIKLQVANTLYYTFVLFLISYINFSQLLFMRKNMKLITDIVKVLTKVGLLHLQCFKYA